MTARALYRAEDHRPRLEGLAPQQLYVPGGFFLGWVVENRLEGRGVGDVLRERFERRQITGPAMFARVGGVLDQDTLGPHAAEFAAAYLPRYFDDVAEQFPVPTIFDIRDTWHNYEWIRITLVDRYAEWRSSGAPRAEEMSVD